MDHRDVPVTPNKMRGAVRDVRRAEVAYAAARSAYRAASRAYRVVRASGAVWDVERPALRAREQACDVALRARLDLATMRSIVAYYTRRGVVLGAKWSADGLRRVQSRR